jgi:hypothetical protein
LPNKTRIFVFESAAAHSPGHLSHGSWAAFEPCTVLSPESHRVFQAQFPPHARFLSGKTHFAGLCSEFRSLQRPETSPAHRKPRNAPLRGHAPSDAAPSPRLSHPCSGLSPALLLLFEAFDSIPARARILPPSRAGALPFCERPDMTACFVLSRKNCPVFLLATGIFVLGCGLHGPTPAQVAAAKARLDEVTASWQQAVIEHDLLTKQLNDARQQLASAPRKRKHIDDTLTRLHNSLSTGNKCVKDYVSP